MIQGDTIERRAGWVREKQRALRRESRVFARSWHSLDPDEAKRISKSLRARGAAFGLDLAGYLLEWILRARTPELFPPPNAPPIVRRVLLLHQVRATFQFADDWSTLSEEDREAVEEHVELTSWIFGRDLVSILVAAREGRPLALPWWAEPLSDAEALEFRHALAASEYLYTEAELDDQEFEARALPGPRPQETPDQLEARAERIESRANEPGGAWAQPHAREARERALEARGAIAFARVARTELGRQAPARTAARDRERAPTSTASSGDSGGKDPPLPSAGDGDGGDADDEHDSVAGAAFARSGSGT